MDVLDPDAPQVMVGRLLFRLHELEHDAIPQVVAVERANDQKRNDRESRLSDPKRASCCTAAEKYTWVRSEDMTVKFDETRVLRCEMGRSNRVRLPVCSKSAMWTVSDVMRSRTASAA